MKTQSITLGDISEEETLRYDVDYAQYHCTHMKNYYSFSELFDLCLPMLPNEDVLYSNFKYCEIGNTEKNGDVNPVILNFTDRNLEDENYYKKIESGNITAVDSEDILISKVRPNLRKFIYIDKYNDDVYYTTAFLRLKPKKMSIILYYGFRTIFYESLMAISRQGKGYPTISENDIVKLRFDKSIIDSLLAKEKHITKDIEKIRQEIHRLKLTVRTSSEIIDEVFEREFLLDYKRFEELKNKKIYFSQESAFSNNPDLRFSAKFHRPAGKFVMSELQRITDRKIKHYIAEPIILGASISPKDFDVNGTAYYVSMATIKTLNVELDDTQLVSDSYFKAKSNKSVMPNDIIIARSRVAIGKSAIVEESFEGVFADFTMRLRFDETKCNPYFAYYYIRSKYFQYLIEIYKKGLQNQNIFPIIIQEFPFPNVSLAEQKRIVDMIQTEMRKQNDTKRKIAELRNSIDCIIESAITA